MRIEFVATDREGQDGEVHGAGAEALEKDRRDLFGDGEMNFWKFAGKSG